ncbi:hypothetical protein U1Q18_044271 [Sarracenia purpurea var. burkii]
MLQKKIFRRWPCAFPLAPRANLVRPLLQWDNPKLQLYPKSGSFRNNAVVPEIARVGRARLLGSVIGASLPPPILNDFGN